MIGQKRAEPRLARRVWAHAPDDDSPNACLGGSTDGTCGTLTASSILSHTRLPVRSPPRSFAFRQRLRRRRHSNPPSPSNLVSFVLQSPLYHPIASIPLSGLPSTKPPGFQRVLANIPCRSATNGVTTKFSTCPFSSGLCVIASGVEILVHLGRITNQSHPTHPQS